MARDRLARLLIGRYEKRPPGINIGGDADTYLRRWYLIPRNPFFNVYLHQYFRGDDDRACHNHPWFSLSLCLRGPLTEFTPRGPKGGLKKRRIKTGEWVARAPWFLHRVEIAPRYRGRVWTLFITGPRLFSWGFKCPQGMVDHKIFTAGKQGELVGRGCGE